MQAALRDPVGILQRRGWWMGVVLALSLLVGIVAWLSLPLRYYAEATVVVSRQQVSEELVQPTIQEDALAGVDALTAEVLSQVQLVPLIEELDLYPSLRRERSMAEVVARVRGDVRIAASRGGSRRSERGATARVYGIGIEAEDPETAALGANRLADAFVNASIARRHRQHQLTTEFISRALTEAEEEFRSHNRKVSEFKRQNRGLLPTDQATSLARLQFLQSQRQSLAIQIAEAESRMVTLASQDATSPHAQLTRLRDKARHLSAKFTDRHPDSIATRLEIEALEAELAAEEGIESPAATPSSLRDAAERSLEALKSQAKQIEAEVELLDKRIEEMPRVDEELFAMAERGRILRENYLEFQRKLQDAQLSEDLLLAQQGERVLVVNRAQAPSQAVQDTGRFLLLSLLAAFGLSLGTGLVLEWLFPVVNSADQMEQLLSAPVLASISHIGESAMTVSGHSA